MFILYNLFVLFAGFFLKFAAIFNPKIKLFVEGRKQVFTNIKRNIAPSDKTIWFHAASLGEFEQGLPVIEKIKLRYPKHKIILTFFSPSGYEIKKNNQVANVTLYLPLDTQKNAQQFLQLTHPEMVFFIKYEYWPNYLNELKKRGIPTYLISGIFRKNQLFFKWFGSFYRKALDTFAYFFVQNLESKMLLLSLGKTNVAVSGDTRFDRVAAILERDNSLDFISEFKNNCLTIVVGSSWAKDETLIVNYINATSHNVKFIIAPHIINPIKIKELKKALTKKTILFSEKATKDLANFDVFIIDTIGILTKIYSQANVVYVGGGFGYPGIHNILEPATFGIPIVIGPNFSHFAEAFALKNLGGCISIANQKELFKAFDTLIQNEAIREEKGHICSTFVAMNTGATAIILKHIGF